MPPSRVRGGACGRIGVLGHGRPRCHPLVMVVLAVVLCSSRHRPHCCHLVVLMVIDTVSTRNPPHEQLLVAAVGGAVVVLPCAPLPLVVVPSPSLWSPPPRCGPLPFVVVPSHCPLFHPVSSCSQRQLGVLWWWWWWW